ncbi:MAG: 3-deoxy-D-manno-octulosonic acid transferase [Burkholderiales bacterium]|nr:3-deoxy-D-manno-octulosonic acid transferase [Burkholderiales bacterium]
MRWVRSLYSLVLWLAQPLLRAKLRRRAQAEPGYGVEVEERFGVYTQPRATAGEANRFIWVHAVSLGEARAAAVLVAQLRSEFPGMRLLLTHGTATGRTQGASLLQPGDVQVWQPWDTQFAVARFLAHFQPRVGLLVETEVWPNMVAACAQRGIPLCLVNARMSEKSMAQAQRLAWLSRPAYAGLHAVWAQSHEDAQRLRQLGATVQGVIGNFKFDVTPDAAQLAKGHAWRALQEKPVLMFASSREGEEQMLLQVFKGKQAVAPVETAQAAIQTIANPVQWLVVPRHPQRFDEVASLFVQAGLTVSRRSTWTGQPQAADVWLGDSLGEMALYFGLADVALLGGSFAPLGGQNLIEAAACGCPVVMGPHTFNFAQAAELATAAGAAFEVADLTAAVNKATQLVATSQELHTARQSALALNQTHQGAAGRTARAVKTLLLG